MLDPYANLDPMTLIRNQQQANARPQPLTPEEEDSLLGKIGGKVLGGLGYAGSVLEKTFGGRALRGALGGKPRELLSLIPGSDTLGITDESDRVSGKDLLGLGHQDDWLSTIGGIGAEIALDPATYLSFGGSALSKGGQVAKKIGVLPKNTAGRATGSLKDILAAQPGLQGAAEAAAGGAAKLAPLLEQSLGGVAGLGLPFREPSLLLGTGQAGANFMSGLGAVGRGIDTTARAIPGIGHVWDFTGKGIDATGRHLNALFDPSVLGATTHTGQELAREATSKLAPKDAALKGFAGASLQKLKAAGASEGGGELRMAMEGLSPTQGALTAADTEVAQGARTLLDEALARKQGLGLNIEAWRDPVAQYAPRQTGTPLQRSLGGRPVQPFGGHDPRLTGRDPILGGILGGTEEGLNKLAVDPLVYQGSELTAAAHIRANYLHSPNAPEAIEQSRRLVDYLRSRVPTGGAPERLFPNHPVSDLVQVGQRGNRLEAAAEAAHGLLAHTALDTLAPGFQAPEGAKRIIEALKDAGLGSQVLNAQVGGQTHLAGLLSQRLGRAVTEADLANFMAPRETLAELGRYMRGFTTPESLGPVLSLFDSITNLTKLGQTALWPAFHVRNLVSGLWQNMVKGATEPGRDAVSGFVKPWMDARRLLQGETLADAHLVPGMAQGISAEEATKQLAREMYQYGIGGHGGQSRQLTGPGGQAGVLAPGLTDLLKEIPGSQPQTLGGALSHLSTADKSAWNPLNTAGVATNADLFAPAKAGRGIGDLIEGTNRGQLYIALRRQGYAPEQAAKEVLQAHFNYGREAMTDFESKVMKRLVPFYTYARQNLPAQLEQLIQRPGGMVGTEARIAHDLRQDAGFLPDYLGSGLAIPMGGENADGTKRFLTRLDLPPEQAFEMVRGGPNAPAKTLMALLGNLNPLVKAPLEFGTGKQFFTGRDLEDLYSLTGNTALDQLLMNSPASRALTTARTLADERKWSDPGALPLNLLTGAKLTDVDLEKQRNIAAREFVTESLRGNEGIGRFTTVYPKAGQGEALTPEDVALLRLNATLERKAQAGKKQVRVLP